MLNKTKNAIYLVNVKLVVCEERNMGGLPLEVGDHLALKILYVWLEQWFPNLFEPLPKSR